MLALVIVAVILAGVTVSGLGFWQANALQSQLIGHLKAGQLELEAAKTSLKQANANHDVAKVVVAKTHFSSAKIQFTAAGRLADGSAILRVAEGTPSVGKMARSQHVAVKGIADMGSAISDAGRDLADLDAQLITPVDAGQPARNLLTVLDTAGPTLDKVRAEFAQAQVAGARVDIKVVPGSQQAAFLKARDQVRAAVAGIDEFQQLVPVLREVLGGNGARTYLVMQVNPAELRPGGGFVGSFSALRADHGMLKLVASGNGYQLAAVRPARGQRGYVEPPGPLREFVPGVSWSFVDSNFFPDFPSNAKTAESFVQNQLGSPVEGVFAIDYYAVAKILEVTGPLKVPGYDVTVDAHNFVPLLIQYDLEQGYTHKAILTAIAGPLFERVSALPPSQWAPLLSALTDLAAGRNLQAYFNNPNVENAMNRFGWSGVLNPTTAPDYMMEVESNLGGTKANYFVTRNYSVLLTKTGATLHHKVTVDLTNNMPAKDGPVVYYHPYVQLFVPDSASKTTDNLVAVKYPSPAPPAGMRMLDGWLPAIQGYGGHGQAVFEYDTPWLPDSSGRHLIYWQKQPGTVNDKINITWTQNGNSYSASGELARDEVITLQPSGVSLTPGQPGQSKLPSISLG